MKAIKLKSSTIENPIWGKWSVDYRKFLITDTPCLLASNYTKIGDFYFRKCNYEEINQWELVTVKITIE